ncbi:putative germin-like protein 2-1 isoform X2 [Prunus yedoensis var. nudiflora]|uniref:Putative germin-like protein 2-1 isoform X2 n=1 Tax=Prunus yedoensis var. nudiflora TaxID=2094558 RepID=A0A314UI66_PRUYE|nr:putative germin-like protein 2-1 isoform X2 [Prunus yedoensis var. nudiflora]
MISVPVNGVVCKDFKLVDANDFFFSGLHLAGNTSNAVGSRVTPVNVAQIADLILLVSPLRASTMHHGELILPTRILEQAKS